MGFFKDFKDDVSQAVNELVDDAIATGGPANNKNNVPDDDAMVDTLEKQEPVKKAAPAPAVKAPAPVPSEHAAQSKDSASETAIITPGLKITGDIESSGAIELLGTVIGNVSCQGKLSVSGTIQGNTHSAAFYSNEAQITGNISCDGAAKIGNGSVVIGDLAATSAVIAGAIKGNIDVHGPVIIDTTAIVMGDIKSESVQINNGAVIEGHCSQCYSDNSPSKFFKDK